LSVYRDERGNGMRRDEALRILRDHKREPATRYGVTRLGLFGSVAKDQAREGSDVDVVVEMRRPDLFFMAPIKAVPIAAKYRAKNREGREDHGLGSASARTWGRQPVAHAAAHGGKPWRYLLIPHDAIVGSLTLAGSHERFGGGDAARPALRDTAIARAGVRRVAPALICEEDATRPPRHPAQVRVASPPVDGGLLARHQTVGRVPRPTV
jgi:hypothetical protein